jgi:hypothetical protein
MQVIPSLRVRILRILYIYQSYQYAAPLPGAVTNLLRHSSRSLPRRSSYAI